METSPQIDALAAALSQAQGEMDNAVRDSVNPFFKSKYPDLASVREACRAPFERHGLSVVQSPSAQGSLVSVETMLLHASGQWIKGTASASAKDDGPQSIGSAITYLRRYALQSFAGVASEDDDAEAATQRNGNGHTVSTPAPAVVRPAVERENASVPSAGGIGHLGTLITKVDATSITKGKFAGKPKWYVHFADGNKASTIDAKLAAQAQQCEAGQLRVQPELKKTDFGYDLMRIFQVNASTALPEVQLNADLQAHTEPVSLDDIPF